MSHQNKNRRRRRKTKYGRTSFKTRDRTSRMFDRKKKENRRRVMAVEGGL